MVRECLEVHSVRPERATSYPERGNEISAQGRATPKAERHPGSNDADPPSAPCNPFPTLLRAGLGKGCRARKSCLGTVPQGVALGWVESPLQGEYLVHRETCKPFSFMIYV